MLKITLIVIAILGVVAVAGIAWAKKNGYCAGGDYLTQVSERVSRKLDLSEEQSGKLQGFVETLKGLRGDWMKRRTRVSDEIERLLAEPTFDRDRVMEVLDEPHRSMAERKREVVDAFADFSDSLLPEQRTKLAEIITARMQHRWGHPRWVH